ncbi:MAG: peptidoglycan DD-metalloendopeptidase family protein [Alphaproteobacteria bacterium]|nr:peptidoglycan DD-metalloendopeptidase family protein [Alphaproteobacteria bacterium]
MLSWIFALVIGPWLVPGPKLPERAAIDFEAEIDPVSHVLALSVPDGITEKRGGPVERAIAVRKGDTVMKVLTRAGLGRADAHATVAALRQVYNPRDLLPGTKLTLSFIALTEGDNPVLSFRALRFKPSVEKTVTVARTWDNRFAAGLSKTPLIRSQARAMGAIRSSLYVDAVRAGVPASVVVELIRAFSFNVDFQRDIHPNDGFRIFYDRLLTTDGKLAKAGDLIYGALTLKGKILPLYRFRLKDGTEDYFNTLGQSVRKTLMRTPVDGARLSSRFGRRRHPILGYTKMHRGIDFAAPRGTPIMAAGRGVITAAGRRGSFGNYVRIRHNTTYSTAYAHMKSIARGIRRGRRVRQGQIIGYVGTTGRSTGPHLHYEIMRNNRQINPLKLKLPSGKKLRGAALKRFLTAKAEIDKAFASQSAAVAN